MHSDASTPNVRRCGTVWPEQNRGLCFGTPRWMAAELKGADQSVLRSDIPFCAALKAADYRRTGSALGQKRAVEIGRPLKNARTDWIFPPHTLNASNVTKALPTP